MKHLFRVLLLIAAFDSIAFPQTVLKQNDKRGKAIETIPLIYIPGIMASPLYDDVDNNNRLVFEERAWLGIKVSSLWLNENGIDPAGNYNIKTSPLPDDSANTLRDELNLIPMDLFKGFFNNMESTGYILDNYDENHSEGENLFCFTYDWRKFNTLNAGLLSGFIDSVLSWTGASSVNLVAHSMGGMVAKHV